MPAVNRAGSALSGHALPTGCFFFFFHYCESILTVTLPPQHTWDVTMTGKLWTQGCWGWRVAFSPFLTIRASHILGVPLQPCELVGEGRWAFRLTQPKRGKAARKLACHQEDFSCALPTSYQQVHQQYFFFFITLVHMQFREYGSWGECKGGGRALTDNPEGQLGCSWGDPCDTRSQN